MRFEHLSIKSLILFILSLAPPLVILFLLGGAISIFRSQLPPEVQPYIGTAYSVLTLCFFAVAILVCVVGYLKYITYKFAFDENALHIERGILNREIISIPYRQIQNINIDRNLFNRLLGLSNLIITTAAHEEKDNEGVDAYEAEGVLPMLDVGRAQEIQNELLERTNIEKVMAVNQGIK
jgi:putative membrane protein